jgi:hypothetical protein
MWHYRLPMTLPNRVKRKVFHVKVFAPVRHEKMATNKQSANRLRCGNEVTKIAASLAPMPCVKRFLRLVLCPSVSCLLAITFAYTLNSASSASSAASGLPSDSAA